VLDCPLIAKLGMQDLHALVAARQVNLQSEGARRPLRLATAPA
jgi:hypothetical protein